MLKKAVVLTHAKCPVKYATRLIVGKWDDKEQKRFIDSVEKKIDDECCCSFDVQNKNYTLCECGQFSFYKIDNRNLNDKELVIIMHPSLPLGEDHNWSCKCGAESGYQCLKNIQTGKCTSSVIKQLVGQVLFPKEY